MGDEEKGDEKETEYRETERVSSDGVQFAGKPIEVGETENFRHVNQHELD